ncbi:MAG: ATPase AAA [Candidatus Entotheonella factor]|uniref:DNA 3'-5' helicase n=1 Tax=Entotheonella factor TaxID=1429438 RepID=W4LPL0_ENTF1|nr:MAG: ATPase AAA [Candidatus Entotheonella factor]
MAFYADLHIHSKYSRATSKNCDLEHLALWAQKKGISVVGTGDFTYPAWLAELKDKLVPAEPGLFRLHDGHERDIAERLPRACHRITRFMLCVEISTIYKKGDKTRKVHHLIYAPDFESVERINHSLGKIGNLGSDGRPILGLDSRHLLEIVLESGPDSYLVPAHIWTPWFAAMGSKSGFDSIDDCYGDLAPHIFAVETGLSSDPTMNWRVSSLDRFRLVSNSDAHSPEKLGREACRFDTGLDYFAMRNALETGEGYEGTVEFFPEEGKYHLDGHRACQVRLLPHETRAADGRCPVCGKPVTVGVMHRIDSLADREEGEDIPLETAGDMQSLVPLPEVLSEIHQVGPKSKRVSQHYEALLNKLGPELMLLNEVPLEDIRQASSSLLAEAITRLRRQQVIREAGYDGEYGVIRLFEAEELHPKSASQSLFADEPLAPRASKRAKETVVRAAAEPVAETARPEAMPVVQPAPMSAANAEREADVLAGLDADQRRAAEMVDGPLLIVAGPGSGKTRTLTHRIAYLIRHHGAEPGQCLAITFTRRAADEMRERLQYLLPDVWLQLPIFTFHSLGLAILQDNWNVAGLQRGFRIAAESERLDFMREALGVSESRARRLLSAVSHLKRTQSAPEDTQLAEAFRVYQEALEHHNVVDYDDLIGRAADILEAEPGLKATYRERYRWVCIDEYQDVDEQQVRLIKHLVPPEGNVCAIGDPDQAIYRFRGADVRYFKQFETDFTHPQIVRLTRNYRSDRNIVALSSQVIAPSGSEQRSVPVLADDPSLITIHQAPTERAEAEFVVQTLEQLLGGHSFFSLDSGRSASDGVQDLSFSDFAVLYRTEAQTPAIIEALARSGMPFQKRSHTLLMDHPGVPGLVDRLRDTLGTGVIAEQLATILAQPGASDDEALVEAAELLNPIALACDGDWERFWAEIAVGSQVDTWDPRADRISLLTLHAAKGLEFPVVFIMGCEAGILPLTWGESDLDELDEERRLFYVGITRAQRRLYLCHAQKRLWRGRVQERTPSPYLSDMEEHLLERRKAQLPGDRGRKRDHQLELF